MAKKKLSRDQKRKLKKRKKQQRKQKSTAGRSKENNPKIKIFKPGDEAFELGGGDIDFEALEARILQVFNAKEIPTVSPAAMQTYRDFIKEHIQLPCLLTGVESMGYFRWEERFEFGYGSQAEYERLRKEYASYHDQYELREFETTVEADKGILVNVTRTTDGKRFTIPLAELEAEDEASDNYILLNDYSVWMINW